jgi:hypothetical protein
MEESEMHQTIPAWITRSGLTNRAEIEQDDWTADMDGPMLSEEVDEQVWLAERLGTKPQGEMRSPATGPAWKPEDYAKMSNGKAVLQIALGGPSVSEETARARLREAMSYMSAPVTVSARSDPWNLRGDRVVVPELEEVEPSAYAVPEEIRIAGEAHLDALVAHELGSVVELLEASDSVLAKANAAMEESDALLGQMLAADKSRRSSGVTDMDDEDNEKPQPKPLVDKPVEPKYRPKYDDWGFPINYPPAKSDSATGSEPPPPEGRPASEERPPASPPSDQLGTDGSAGAASLPLDAGQPEPRTVVMEGTMNTRVQLTEYVGNEYTGAGNFEVDGASPQAVLAILAVIQEISLGRHAELVGAGTALSKGGVRVRIQLQPKPTRLVDGRRVKGEPVAGAGFENLRTRGLRLAEVKLLVNYQLKLHFGIGEGDPAELLRAWEAFAGKAAAQPVATVEAEEITPVNATGEPLPLPLTDLVGKVYSKRLHLGLCCVVREPSLKVLSLWEREADAVAAAGLIGARVVDAEGYLVPKNRAAEAPAPEVRA